MILQGNSIVQNLHAFFLFFSTIPELDSFLVQEKFLNSFLHILKMNSSNCIAFYLLNGFQYSQVMLYKLLINSDYSWKDLEDTSSRQMHITPKKLFSSTVQFSNKKKEFVINALQIKDENKEKKVRWRLYEEDEFTWTLL
jgi:hypothetical protein